MRLVSFVGFVVVASASFAGAQQQQQDQPRMAASSFATVEVHVNARPIGNRWYAEDAGLTGPARIAISYGQPHARGRKIVGGLIPNDTVWRFGANEAATLHTDLDLTLGSLPLTRGDYSLLLLHSGNAWQLIVNRKTGYWGTDHDASADIGKVPLTARTTTDNEESFTIYLVPNSQNPTSGYATLGGTLRVRWGTVDLSTPWTVKQ